MADPQQDLDAFLTVVESKLRAPFSSLDWAKTATTAALRGTESTSDYLQRLGQVIGRTDKITQMRIIIGLLGIEDHEDEIAAILENVQESESEEWVRIIAGLVQGILFEERGEQAAKMLEKTCQEVIDKVRDLEYETESLDGDDENDAKPHEMATADVEPTFAPYRYALIQKSLLEQVIPEIQSHPHFGINKDAEILSMDEKLEVAKAAEDQQHGLQATNMNNRQTSTASSNGSKDITTPIFPGNRLGKSNSAANATSKVNRPKSSMFMPSKKPISMTNATATKQPVKTTLHTRKAGAAQALLAAKRRSRMMTAEGHGNNNTGTSTTTAAASTGSGGRAALAKSKMKMIDVTEVQGLANEKSQIAAASETKKSMAGGLKRKAASLAGEEKAKKMDRKAAAQPTLATTTATAAVEPTKTKAPSIASQDVALATTTNTTPPPPPLQQAAGALASAALSAYQAQFAGTTTQPQEQSQLQQQQQQQAAHAAKQQDWRQMLHEKSNKLTDEDRLRVQQFFVDHFNPTPDQPMYKMKLHEERTTDPKTGEPVKETFYLELDYDNFSSKQFKKVKRYK